MKRLHLYLIKSFLGPFFMAFAIAMIILMLNFVWLYIDEIVGKGLKWNVIAELVTYVSAQLIPRAMILGILLASVMSFGNLGEHYELTALKSSGISLIRTMYPVLIFVAILGAGSLAFSNYVIPVTNMKFYTLFHDIRQQRPEIDIKEKQFYNGIDGYSLYIGDRSKDGMTLFDLMIYDHSQNKGNVAVTMADSGNMRISEGEAYLILTLYSGYSYIEQLSEENNIQENKPLRLDNFAKQVVLFNLPGSELKRSKEDLYKDRYQMMNLKQLKEAAYKINEEMVWERKKVGHDLLEQDYLRLENKKEVRADSLYYSLPETALDPLLLIGTLLLQDQREVYRQAQTFSRLVQKKLNDSSRDIEIRNRWEKNFWNERNNMFVNAFACILFFLIGASLGAIIRKGGLGTPVVVSVVFFIAYYMLNNLGEKYSIAGFAPSWLGMWGATFLLLPFGLFLTFKSNNDSKILSTEAYILMFRRLLRIDKKKQKKD